jgi:hypothetical protein
MSARAAVSGLTLALMLALPAQIASAHGLDEYLQASRLEVSRQGVVVEIDLTPGAAMAAAILSRADRDRDGTIDPLEAGAYGRAVVADLVLTIDGRDQQLALVSAGAPESRDIEAGVGAIRVVARASLDAARADRMVVHFRNNHAPAGSVYLVNALKSTDARLVLDRQRRDLRQREIELDYRLSLAARSQLLWALIAALGLAALVALRSARRRGRLALPWHTAHWLTREEFRA